MLRLLGFIIFFITASSAWPQSTRTFQNYMQGLPAATRPLSGTEPTIIMQGGVVKQTPAAAAAQDGVVFNAVSNGWKCDTTDHSTDANNLFNAVLAAGGGTIFFPACPVAQFVASGSGTTLTVSSVTQGPIPVPSVVAGDGITPNLSARNGPRTLILSQLTGPHGGVGTYQLNQASTSSNSPLIAQATYRADAQLSIPLLTNTSGDEPTAPPIRLTGPGSGMNLNDTFIGASTVNNLATLDLRYQGMQMSHIGFTAQGGSGYTNGTGMQTLTLSGGSGPVATFGAITGGAGGTPGTYLNVLLTGGFGNGVKANVTVGAGGNVTSVSLSGAYNGFGYLAGDSLTTAPANIGNTSGFSVKVGTVTSNFTCAIAPQWKVVVSGGIVQNQNQPGISGTSPSESSIGVVNQGNCSVVPSNPVTVTSTDGGTGATFYVFWVGGKLQALGGGTVEIDHLNIIDAGSVNSTAMVYTTNAVLTAYDNNFDCSGDPMQDAIVQGGLLGSGYIQAPNDTTDSPMLGFGSKIDHNNTNGCGRFYFGRTFAAQMSITNNIANGACVGDRFIEFLSTQTGVLSPFIANNYTEQCTHLRYGIVESNTQNATYLNNSFYDLATVPGYVSDYVIDPYIMASGSTASAQGYFNMGFGCFNYSNVACQTVTGAPNSVNFQTYLGQVVGAAQFFPGSINQSGYFNNTMFAPTFTAVGADCPRGGTTFINGALGNGSPIGTIGYDDKTYHSFIFDVTDSGCHLNQTAPLVLNPSGAPISFGTYPNDPVVGTSNGFLASVTSAGNLVITTAGATSGAIGIVVGNGGTTGSTPVVMNGTVFCKFDGTPTPSDYVQISATNNGNCHDAGAAYPTVGQIIGRVLGGIIGPFFTIEMFPEIHGPGAGVSCAAGTVSTATLTITSGIVTHC